MPPERAEALAAAFAHCESAVREADKDRWLAALFAPEAMRPDLNALHAFNIEIASVRERVSEPLPGEVRLQWWRDVLTGEGRGDVTGHPVAAAILDVIGRRNLAIKPLVDLIDARVFDLYDDPMPTVNDLEGYCGETSSALMQIAALILAGGDDPGTADLAGHAGAAYAMTGLLRAFPLHAARGQVFIPADILADSGVSRDDIVAGREGPGLSRALDAMRGLAEDHLAKAEVLAAAADPRTVAAFLPMAAARLYLGRMDRLAAAPFRTSIEVAQWRRQWALWRMARRFGRAGAIRQ
ncbi:MAG: squalene/phytoene synthase family protein [Proteobacteria bacterium]|nr:squalene/phytoene synthase family protein [Pseudomonadota bacterium]